VAQESRKKLRVFLSCHNTYSLIDREKPYKKTQENTLTVRNDSYSLLANSSEANVALPFGAIQVFK
jgi:hypothetical protein